MGGESREEGQESTGQPEPPEQRIAEEAEGKPGPERVERGNTLPPISVHPPYPLGAEILRGSERCHDLVEQPPPWGRADARLLGRCVGTHLRDLMDPLCEEWVEGVYKRLRLPWPMDSPLGRQETGSFRSLYEKLMDGPLPQTLKRRILAHDLAWAEKEGWRKRNRKRGAVFCTVHNKRVRQYLLDMGPAES
jgi:hypothetical protein